MNIDRRRKYYLVLDVETANTTEDALVYDLGFAVCDRKGNIYAKWSLIVNDVFFEHKELMKSAYYAEKLPQYYKGMKTGEWQVVSLYKAREIIKRVITDYKIEMVLAYNASFDYNALNTTQRYITKSKYRYFLPYGVKVGCIWAMACQTILCQKSFLRWAVANDMVSASGNIKTSAETVYAYLSGNKEFEESHTGLKDVEIEAYIFAQCMRQHKKMSKKINRFCWRIPTARAKELAIL